LTFIGDGVQRANLEVLVKEKQLEDQVWFYGACYDEKVNAELIYNADLCVAPGNVGLTAMHTMVFGCPVVTHDDFTMQMPEFESIKPGITGDFFKYGNEEELCKTIENWFENKNYNRETIRKACYDEIDSSWTPDFQIKVIKDVIK
jgi:glycosyltransferase involved in cell wall biosynthesis